MTRLRLAWATAAMVGGVTEVAAAQPTGTAEILTPPGHRTSAASAISPGQRGGWVNRETDWFWDRRPVIWSDAENAMVDLAPPNVTFGEVRAMDGNMQGGYVVASAVGIYQAAAIWSGSAESYISLRPSGAEISAVHGMKAEQQVGEASDGAGRRAAKWQGASWTYENLHPSNYEQSVAYRTDGARQVGAVVSNDKVSAAMWSGSASSLVDLGKDHAGHSRALAIDGDEQVGYYAATTEWFVYDEPYRHASGRRPAVWHGTSDSLIDLTPSGANGGAIYESIDGVRVGETFGSDPSQFRATLWLDDGSTFDLHALLPTGYNSSVALDMIRDGYRVDISGLALESLYWSHAVHWTIYIPEPTTLPFAAAGCALMRRRRR